MLTHFVETSEIPVSTTAQTKAAGKGEGKGASNAAGKDKSKGLGSDLCRRRTKGLCTLASCRYKHRCTFRMPTHAARRVAGLLRWASSQGEGLCNPSNAGRWVGRRGAEMPARGDPLSFEN